MTSGCNGQDSIVGISLVKVQTFKVIQGNAHSSILRKPRDEKAAQHNTRERLLQSTTEGPHLQGHPRLHLCFGLPAPSYFLSGLCLLLCPLLPHLESRVYACLWIQPSPDVAPFADSPLLSSSGSGSQSKHALTRLLPYGCPLTSPHSFLGLCRPPEPVSWALYFPLNTPFYLLAQRDGEGACDLILSYKLRM